MESRLDEITTKLNDHQDQLDTFERRANELSLPPFVDSTPSFQARTIDELRNLADDVDDIVAAIEWNATISEEVCFDIIARVGVRRIDRLSDFVKLDEIRDTRRHSW